MVTNSEAARRPRIPQDDYDGELYCDWCTEQTGSRGKLGVYLNLGGGRLLLGILTRSRSRPGGRVGFAWRIEELDNSRADWVKCRTSNCRIAYDTGQEALQRAYALRDRDTGRIRLTERLSVRR